MQTNKIKETQLVGSEIPLTPLYLRRREAARLLSVSLGTLDSFIKRGVLPVIRPSLGVVLIRRDDLHTALNRFRVEGVREEA